MRLLIHHPKAKEKNFSTEAFSVFIGRTKPGQEVDLDLYFDKKVSRQHAKITYDGAKYLLEDLGSTNRTFVNDKQVTEETVITPNDKIKIGETILQLMEEVSTPAISKHLPIQVLLAGQLDINYSLLHAGVPFLSKIVLVNESEQTLKDINMRLILSSYGDSEPIQIAQIDPHEKYELPEPPSFSFNRERLGGLAEKEKVRIVVEINGEEIQNVQPREIEPLPPNAWYCVDHEVSLAGFVMPNCDVVNEINNRAKFELSCLMPDNSRSFVDAIDSADPKAAEKIIKAIYYCLQERYGINYAYEPCYYAPWQAVRFPHEVITNHRGTCIDLAVLFASCIENLNLGIDPVIFLIQTGSDSGYIIQHAVLGFWLDGSLSFDPILTDCKAVMKWVKEGKLLILDSIGFSEGKQANQNFSICKKKGKEHLVKACNEEQGFGFIYGVNIAVAHDRVPPMPFGKGLHYERAAHLAIYRARHKAVQFRSSSLCARHLFLGFLSLQDGLLQQFFFSLDINIDKIIDITSNSFKETEETKKYVRESENWKHIFKNVKKKKDDTLISEEDLIIEIFNATSNVDNVLKKLGLSPAYCLSEFLKFLDKGPVPSLWHSTKV